MSVEKTIELEAVFFCKSQKLTLQDVAAHYRVTERTIQRWIASGDFPAPSRPGNGRIPLWSALDVLEHDLTHRRGR